MAEGEIEHLPVAGAPMAEGETEYTRSGHQWQKGRQNIPVAGTNGTRREHAPPCRARRRASCLARMAQEYTRSGHQWQKGRQNIPAAGTNGTRGEHAPPCRARRRASCLARTAPPPPPSAPPTSPAAPRPPRGRCRPPPSPPAKHSAAQDSHSVIQSVSCSPAACHQSIALVPVGGGRPSREAQEGAPRGYEGGGGGSGRLNVWSSEDAEEGLGTDYRPQVGLYSA
eukprot:1165309-Prorocentrum_minimum.AAC.3